MPGQLIWLLWRENANRITQILKLGAKCWQAKINITVFNSSSWQTQIILERKATGFQSRILRRISKVAYRWKDDVCDMNVYHILWRVDTHSQFLKCLYQNTDLNFKLELNCIVIQVG